MAKYKYIITLIILILLVIVVWRTSMLFTNVADLFSGVATSPDPGPATTTSRHEEIINPDKSLPAAGNRNAGRDAGIQGIIARLKRDVVVTGTITGVPGEESAMFQIEGRPDKEFRIDTRLRDGFIIQEITKSSVVLKNQSGDETVTLDVQRGKGAIGDTRPEYGIDDTTADLQREDPPPVQDTETGTLDSPAETPEMVTGDPSSPPGVDNTGATGETLLEPPGISSRMENPDTGGEDPIPQKGAENRGRVEDSPTDSETATPPEEENSDATRDPL